MFIIERIITATIKAFTDFYNSYTFSFIKFLIGIYVAVLLIDIVLLLFQRGLSGDIRDTLFGMDIPKEMAKKKSKSKTKMRWDAIRKRLESDNESEYKVAVIEADNLVDDILSKLGYAGANMSERLDNIPPGQVEHIEELKFAHEVRNRIIHDEKFELTGEKAREVLDNFESFLKYFQVLE